MRRGSVEKTAFLIALLSLLGVPPGAAQEVCEETTIVMREVVREEKPVKASQLHGSGNMGRLLVITELTRGQLKKLLDGELRFNCVLLASKGSKDVKGVRGTAFVEVSGSRDNFILRQATRETDQHGEARFSLPVQDVDEIRLLGDPPYRISASFLIPKSKKKVTTLDLRCLISSGPSSCF